MLMPLVKLMIRNNCKCNDVENSGGLMYLNLDQWQVQWYASDRCWIALIECLIERSQWCCITKIVKLSQVRLNLVCNIEVIWCHVMFMLIDTIWCWWTPTIHHVMHFTKPIPIESNKKTCILSHLEDHQVLYKQTKRI